MSEESRLEKMEREMMGMRPRGMAGGVLEQLSEKMEERSGRAWGDWFLAGAMGSGVAAAVVIVAMLWVQPAGDGAAPKGESVIAAGTAMRAGDCLAMYARMDGNWDGVVR